ncbi:hypothetical protein R1M29_13235, partial [Klebsiella sp. 91194]
GHLFMFLVGGKTPDQSVHLNLTTTVRRMALSERITDETRRQVKESFPELNEMCQLSVKEIFLSEAYRAFGDALFLSLAETTIEFASHDPQRAREIIALGFEAMWHALHEADAK